VDWSWPACRHDNRRRAHVPCSAAQELMQRIAAPQLHLPTLWKNAHDRTPHAQPGSARANGGSGGITSSRYQRVVRH